MGEMTAELDNLRAARDWGGRHEKFESLSKAVRAFGWYYEFAGLIHEGIEQLESLARALRAKPRKKRTDKF